MSGFFCTMLQFSPSSYYKSHTFTGSFNKVYQSSAHASIQYLLKAPQNLNLSICCIF